MKLQFRHFLTLFSVLSLGSATAIAQQNNDCQNYSSDLIISEIYDSQSGSYGLIELYNNTGQTVNLNGYVIKRYGDIGDAESSAEIELTGGNVAHGQTYVIQLGTSGTTCNFNPNLFPSNSGFNGNDEFKLFKNNILIDVSRAPEYAGYNIVRNASVLNPSASYNGSQWTITAALNNCTTCCQGIGTHQMNISYYTVPTAQTELTHLTCTSNEGLITITAPIGNQYTYSINGTDFQASTTFTVTEGTYQVIVKEGNCESTPVTVTINQPNEVIADPTFTITQPYCDNNNPISTGTIVVLPASDSYLYSIDGINYQSSNVFTELAAGNYAITIKQGECISNEVTAVINEIIIPSFVINGNTYLCENSSEILSITANNFILQDAAYVKWFLNGNLIAENQSSIIITESGEYITEISLENGCSTTQAITIVSSVITAEISSNCVNEQFTLVVNSNGNENFEYLWSTGETTSSIFVNEVGVYTVTISDGICSKDFTFNATSVQCSIPKGISPTGADNLNDTFDLSGFGIVPSVEIFNRYGTQVYSKKNYSNEWHGQSNNGKELPTGTYYYMIELPNGKQKTGWVYLMNEI